MVNEQEILNLSYFSKGIRLDIYVKDKENTIYNVEMQKVDNKNLLKRIRYYQSSIDYEMLKKGKDYNNLRDSYIIFICTFDPFKGNKNKYTIQKACKEDSNALIEDGTHAIILNTKGIGNDISEEIISFLNYVDNSDEIIVAESNGTLVKHIHEKLNWVKKNDRMAVEYMTLEEKYKEKLEEGLKEGLKEGENKGVLLAKSVFKLSKDGMSVSDIAKELDITEEYVIEILE